MNVSVLENARSIMREHLVAKLSLKSTSMELVILRTILLFRFVTENQG